MKIAIVGSRTFTDFEKLKEILSDFLFGITINEIISGGAKGADSLARKYAEWFGIKYSEFLPDWNELGISAGFKRNQQIVDNCDVVVAFWDGVSRGTKDTINKARISKKPTFIVYF